MEMNALQIQNVISNSPKISGLSMTISKLKQNLYRLPGTQHGD